MNDAIVGLPEETLILHRRLTSLEEGASKSQLDDRIRASMIDNHQEWQIQVEAKMSDIMTDLQLKEVKLNELQNSQSSDSTNSHAGNDRLEDRLVLLERRLGELQNSQSSNSHSENDRLEDRLVLLERQLEEQRRKVLFI